MEKDVVITYETLFEIFRREKSRDDLQSLDEHFMADVSSYIAEKKLISPSVDDYEFERERQIAQIANIKKLVKGIYDRREKKIVEMAINKALSGSSVIDTGAMLNHEKRLFDSLVNILEKSRNEILARTINSEKIETLKEPENCKEDEKEGEKEEEKPKTLKTAELSTETSNCRFLRFLSHVPKFVGFDLKTYGPFEEENTARIPVETAQLLLKSGKAEEIKEE